MVKNHSYVEKTIQLMLKDERETSGWVTCVIAGLWVQAKIYDEPSKYGIDNGRVSKLVIAKTAMRDPHKSFGDQMQYSYDRGPDKDETTDPLLVGVVVAALEKLPALELSAS